MPLGMGERRKLSSQSLLKYTSAAQCLCLRDVGRLPSPYEESKLSVLLELIRMLLCCQICRVSARTARASLHTRCSTSSSSTAIPLHSSYSLPQLTTSSPSAACNKCLHVYTPALGAPHSARRWMVRERRPSCSASRRRARCLALH